MKVVYIFLLKIGLCGSFQVFSKKQNICGLFHVLPEFVFTASETEVHYHHWKVNV